MRSRAIPVAGLMFAALIAAAGPVWAQDQVEAEPEVQEPAGRYENGVFIPEGNTLEEVLEQRAANRRQADDAHRHILENQAALADYAKAQAAYEAELARIEEEKRAIEAEAARVAAEHEAAMAKWREDVAACERGDKNRCAPKAKK